MTTKPTIIDFVEKYTREFASHVFLREKPADRWTETTFEQTRLESYRVAAGLMALGIEKGHEVSLLSEGRNMWGIGNLDIYWYGVIIAVGFGLGLWVYLSHNRTCGIHPDEGLDVILWAMVGAIVGARRRLIHFFLPSTGSIIVAIRIQSAIPKKPIIIGMTGP